MLYTSLTSTKREFTDQLSRRINSATEKLDAKIREDYQKTLKEAEAAKQADPEWIESVDDLKRIIGRAASDYILSNAQYRYFSSEYGLMGKLQAKYQISEQPTWTAEKIQNEMIYLSGAFATTKVKYWNMWFPPTKEFVETLGKKNLTLEELKAAILAFANALA